MGFYKPDERELRDANCEILRRHIAECHKEIDRTEGLYAGIFIDQKETIKDLKRDLENRKPYKTAIGDIETWHNLPALVPVGLIPEGRTPCEVRSLGLPFEHDWINASGCVSPAHEAAASCLDGLRILLADKPAVDPPPTWVPPSSLPNCIATASGDGFQESVAFLHCTHARMKELYRDYTEPAPGRWQVTKGTATWLGE